MQGDTQQCLVLRDDIIVMLCSDNFIRVFKKNQVNRFDIESLFVISRIQAIILLLFKNANTEHKASLQISQLLDADYEKARIMVKEITDRYSVLLNVSEKEAMEESIPKELIQILNAKDVKRAKELEPAFKRLDVPSSVVLFISDTCMCNCIYCRVDSGYSSKNAEYMSLDIVKRIAGECSKYGIKDIEITGGDPVTHPEFIKILQIFQSCHLPVKFSTKCPLDKHQLKEIKKTGLKILQISLDSIDAQSYAKLTGTSEGYFQNIMQTVQNAVNLGLNLRIKSVITQVNIKQLKDMIVSLSEQGIYDFALQQLSSGDRAFANELMPEKKQFIQFDHEITALMKAFPALKIEKAYNLEFVLSDERQRKYFRPDCMAGRNGIAVQTDGSYAFCGQSFNKELRFLNVLKVSLLEAWNSKELMEKISPPKEFFLGTKCYTCKDYNICLRKRCYVRVLNETGKLYDADPMCPY